jgi:WD40 repeat protein
VSLLLVSFSSLCSIYRNRNRCQIRQTRRSKGAFATGFSTEIRKINFWLFPGFGQSFLPLLPRACLLQGVTRRQRQRRDTRVAPKNLHNFHRIKTLNVDLLGKMIFEKDDVGQPIESRRAATTATLALVGGHLVTAGSSIRWHDVGTGGLVGRVAISSTALAVSNTVTWVGDGEFIKSFNARGEMLSDWNLGLGHISHLALCNEHLWVVTEKLVGEKWLSIVYSVNPNTQDVAKVAKLDRKCALFGFHPKGNVFAVVPMHTRHPIPSEKLILFTLVGEKWTQSRHVHDQPLSCLAFSPVDSILATGDLQGKITLWYYQTNQPKVPKTQLHWHAHPVAALAFSPDGTRLYSGGMESVLVTWTLATSEKTFFPRMGSEIVGLAVGLDHGKPVLGIGHADNSVRIMNGVQSTKIQGVKSIKSMAGMLTDTRGNLVLWGDKAHPTVQFYNAASEKSVATLDLSSRNKVVKGVSIRIGHVAVHSGNLVTYEASQLGRTLRFWKWDGETYIQDTVVPDCAELTGLALHGDQCITTGQNLCLWKRGDGWQLVFKFAMQSSLPRWSSDGSVLVFVGKAGIVVWNPESMSRVITLTLAGEQAVDLGFCNARLIVGTNKGLYVWDLKSMLRIWEQKTPVTALATYGNQFSVIINGTVSVLDSNTFAEIWREAVSNATKVTVAHRLVAVLTQGDLLMFSTEKHLEKESKKTRKERQNLPMGLNGIYGPIESVVKRPENDATRVETRNLRALDSILDQPAHVMPPLIKLFDVLMLGHIGQVGDGAKGNDASVSAANGKDESHVVFDAMQLDAVEVDQQEALVHDYSFLVPIFQQVVASPLKKRK